MLPFFLFAYRGKNIGRTMNFKRDVWTYTDDEYREFYAGLSSISRHRKTDLNDRCIAAIKGAIDQDDSEILDVGCGSGYLLKTLQEKFPDRAYKGLDVVGRPDSLPESIEFESINISRMELPVRSFDVVTCCHVLEHILDYRSVLKKLVGAARRKVIFVVPIQRPYLYTLDEHVNFFLFPEQFAYEVGLQNFQCRRVDGDLLYIGEIR